MEGSNELELNAAEVCQAIEFYLNSQIMKRRVKVSRITARDSGVSNLKQVSGVRMSIVFEDDQQEGETDG